MERTRVVCRTAGIHITRIGKEASRKSPYFYRKQNGLIQTSLVVQGVQEKLHITRSFNSNVLTGRIDEEIILDPNENANKILNDINIGSMTPQEVHNAKNLIHHYCKRQTIQDSMTSEKILDRLYNERIDGGNQTVKISAKDYNVIIKSYARSPSLDGAEKAELLVEKMLDRFEFHKKSQEAHDIGVAPDEFTYHSLLTAWCSNKSDGAIQKAEDLLAYLESDDSEFQPNSWTYNIMMNGYANQDDKFGYAQKAEDMLLLMTALQKDGNSSINPGTLSFNIVLKAWRNSGGGVESANRAKDILQLMMKLHADGHLNVKPDRISFLTVMDAYIKHCQNKEDLAAHIEHVMDLLFQSDLGEEKGLIVDLVNQSFEYIRRLDLKDVQTVERVIEKFHVALEKGETYDKPNMDTYSLCIATMLRNSATRKKGEAMLEKLKDGHFDVVPDSKSMNRILQVFCYEYNQKDTLKFFQSMQDFTSSKQTDAFPDTVSYGMMARMYSATNDKDSRQGIINLLKDMEEAYSEGKISKLDPFVYDVCIQKLSKSNFYPDHAKAQDILMNMIKKYDEGHLEEEPDVVLWNAVMTGFCNETKHHDVHSNTWDLFNLMRERNMKTFTPSAPDSVTFLLLIQSHKFLPDRIAEIVDIMEKESRLRPNGLQLTNRIYETTLFALSYQKYGDRKLAEKIFQNMIELERSGVKKEKASRQSLDHTIRAQCIDDANQGHVYLMNAVKRFENGDLHILPTVEGFNAVLYSWVNTRHRKAFRKAEEIYRTMTRLAENNTSIKPCAKTNSLLLRIYHKSNRKRVRSRAIKFFEKLDDDTIDLHTYNVMLMFLSSFHEKNIFEKANAIFERMKSRDMFNEMSYNSMLHICARTGGSLEEFLTLYEDALSSNCISDRTFSYVLRHLTSVPEKIDVLKCKEVFDTACERGLLSQRCIMEIKQSFPSEEDRSENFAHDLVMEIPKSWQHKCSS